MLLLWFVGTWSLPSPGRNTQQGFPGPHWAASLCRGREICRHSGPSCPEPKREEPKARNSHHLQRKPFPSLSTSSVPGQKPILHARLGFGSCASWGAASPLSTRDWKPGASPGVRLAEPAQQLFPWPWELQVT